MTSHVASTVILCAAAVGAGVWLASVIRAVQLLSVASGEKDREVLRAQIEGEPADVARRIARALTGATPLGMSPVRVDVLESRVRFWTPAGAAVMPLGAGLEGEFALKRSGDATTLVRLAVNRAAERRGAKVALALGLLVALPILVALPAALLTWVAPHELASVRVQAVQVVHVGHALWPPFLVMWLGRRSQVVFEASLAQVLDRLRFGG